MKKAFALLFCIMFLVSIIPVASASAGISELEKKYGGKITIDPSYEGKITDEHIAIADAFLEKSTRISTSTKDVPPDVDGGSSSGITSGTASVWAGVPAVGHCYINTPYTITYSVTSSGYNNINSCSLGSSYMTGLSMATFAFTRNTWSKIGYSTARITAYGTLTYGIPGTPLYYTTGEQGFQADISISGL